MKLCEALSGSVCGTRALTEAEVVERGFSMKGVLGYAEGIFSVCDRENKNHRIYESVLWENTLKSPRIIEMVEGKLLLGEPDHPETRTQSVIREGSHTVVEARKEGQYIRGTVAVFDNPLGRIVWPMLEAGVKLGFSTRGDGDLIEESRSGRTRVDPNTYEWHGVDFVLNPSFVEARPEAITEDTRKRVRLALTEAVDTKKLGDDQQALKEDVEALLAPVEESAEDVVSANPTKGLELALTQLEEAKIEVKERDDLIIALQNQLSEMKARLDSMQSENRQLEAQLDGARKKTAVAEAARDRAHETLKSARTDFKGVVAKTQDAHAQFASTHRKLQLEHAQLKAKHRKGIKIVEALRGQLVSAQKRLSEAEARATSAEQQLKEQEGKVPQVVREETLKQYKRIVTEGMEVPARFKPLLESAKSEADVDTVIESIREAYASRYPTLPFFGSEHSREDRAAIANHLVENTQTTNRDEEDDEEAEEMRRVSRATMSRS